MGHPPDRQFVMMSFSEILCDNGQVVCVCECVLCTMTIGDKVLWPNGYQK